MLLKIYNFFYNVFYQLFLNTILIYFILAIIDELTNNIISDILNLDIFFLSSFLFLAISIFIKNIFLKQGNNIQNKEFIKLKKDKKVNFNKIWFNKISNKNFKYIYLFKNILFIIIIFVLFYFKIEANNFVQISIISLFSVLFFIFLQALDL